MLPAAFPANVCPRQPGGILVSVAWGRGFFSAWTFVAALWLIGSEAIGWVLYGFRGTL